MPTAKLKEKVKAQDERAFANEAGEQGPDEFGNEIPDLGQWVDFEANPVFVGRYLGTHEGTIPKADGTMGVIHDFVDDDGVAWSIPGHVMLTRKLGSNSGALIGKRVRIEHRGTLEPTQKGRKGAEDYSVRF